MYETQRDDRSPAANTSNATNAIAYRAVSDETLVLASLVADFAAFDELIRRYRGALTHLAFDIVGSRAVAEEIVQDTLVIAWQSLPNLDEPQRFAGWLRAIARFRALRVAEREKRNVATEDEPLHALAEERNIGDDLSGDPALHATRQSERTAVTLALDGLSAEHREALFLHYGEQWSLERIAAFLSVPETTIKGRLFRAREALRRKLTADTTFDDVTVKGTKPHERIRGNQSRTTPTAPDAEANVQPVGALQPNRSLVGGAVDAVEQYNRILRRLEELKVISPAMFSPLPLDASFDRLGVVSKLLEGYLAEEVAEPSRENSGGGHKIIIGNSMGDLSGLEELKDLGRVIRENLPDFLRRRTEPPVPPTPPTPPTPPAPPFPRGPFGEE